jgi:hypothetical protein
MTFSYYKDGCDGDLEEEEELEEEELEEEELEHFSSIATSAKGQRLEEEKVTA